MSILHDELAKLKAAVDRAIEFADPAAYIAEAEAAFKAAIADEVELVSTCLTALAHKVQALEERMAALAPAPSTPSPDAQAAQNELSPHADTQAGDTAAPQA